jgi:hypothetical protein
LFLFGNWHNVLSLKGFIILFLSRSAYPDPAIDNYPAKAAPFRDTPAADSPAPDPVS